MENGKITELLSAVRRERNGLVADTARYYGARYGTDYGVSLPTLRKIARAMPADHDFACTLYTKPVRELRLAALYLAEPEKVTADEFSFWATGIINSEVAEEAAFALLNRIPTLPALFEAWIAAKNPLLQYAALLAAARSGSPATDWIVPAIAAVRCSDKNARLLVAGATALLTAIGAQNAAAVRDAVATLGASPAEKTLKEEMAWRLE